MAEQFKSMSPEDVREQKMRDNMGKAAEKSKENSLGSKDDKSFLQKAFEYIDPSLKSGPINQSDRDVQDAKKITNPAYKVNNQKNGGKVKSMAKGGSTDKWIQHAVHRAGALREALGIKEGHTIPKKKLEAAAHKPGKLGQRARLAETLKGFKK